MHSPSGGRGALRHAGCCSGTHLVADDAPSSAFPAAGASGKRGGMALTDVGTLPETNSSPLKMDDWNTTFLLGWPVFRCELLVLGRVNIQWLFLVPLKGGR